MSRVVCFRNLCPLETVLSVREFLKDQVYDTLFDSVDLAPSWEFYPVTRGEWQAGTPCRLDFCYAAMLCIIIYC